MKETKMNDKITKNERRKAYCSSKFRVVFRNTSNFSFIWKAVLSNKNSRQVLKLIQHSMLDVNQTISYEDLDDRRQKMIGSNLLIILARSTFSNLWHEEVEIAAALIKRGLDVNDVETNENYGTQNTALHYALKRGNARLAELLYEHGAYINAIGWTRCLPRYAQLWMQNPTEILPLLYRHETGPNKLEFIKLMISYSVPQDGIVDKFGITPLLDALQFKDDQLITSLIKNGADVNYTKNGVSPLSLAIYLQHLGIVKALLDKGAKPNLRLMDDQTVLHIACRERMSGKVSMLLKYGADTNVKDCYGKTPLQFLVDDTDTTVIDTCKEIILKDLALLASLGLGLYDREFIRENKIFHSFFVRCLKELTLMKAKYVKDKVTTFDLIVCPKHYVESLSSIEEENYFIGRLYSCSIEFYLYAPYFDKVRDDILLKRDSNEKHQQLMQQFNDRFGFINSIMNNFMDLNW